MSANVTVQDHSILLRAQYSDRETSAALPGARWSSAQKAWSLPKTPVVAWRIKEAYDGDLSADAEFDRLIAIYRHTEAHSSLRERNDLPLPAILKTRPWNHQLQAYHFSLHTHAVMLEMGMRTGKTKVVIDLIVNRKMQHVLVICPHSVVDVWSEQTILHAGAAVQVLALSTGSIASKEKRAKQQVSGITVVNYESAWREPFRSFVLSQTWDLIVLDESHKIKAPGSKVSLFCAQLLKHSRRRMCLSGTPMANGPLDVYAQFRFLDPGVFGTSFERFAREYSIPDHFGGVKHYQNLDDLRQKYLMLTYRASRDLLDLPPTMHVHRYCRLEPKAQHLYDDLDREFYAEIDSTTKELTLPNVLSKMLRLQQLTGGALPHDEDFSDLTTVSTSKEELLAEVLEEIPRDEPVVVFTRFSYDLSVVHRVAAKVGRSSMELSGQRKELKEWQDGQSNVLGVQIKSGGLGISLERAAYVIYYSVGYSLTDYDQSLARPHGPEQTRAITYVHLIARGTIDEDIYTAIDAKREIVDYVLERRIAVKTKKG